MSEAVAETKVEETENKEVKNQISEDHLKTLSNIRDASLQIRNAIGDLELRKQELMIQYINVKQQMEKEAEASLLESGVDPKDIKEYRIDLKTGEYTR